MTDNHLSPAHGAKKVMKKLTTRVREGALRRATGVFSADQYDTIRYEMIF